MKKKLRAGTKLIILLLACVPFIIGSIATGLAYVSYVTVKPLMRWYYSLDVKQ